MKPTTETEAAKAAWLEEKAKRREAEAKAAEAFEKDRSALLEKLAAEVRSETIEEARAKLAHAQELAAKTDDEIERQRTARRALSRFIEAATLEIQRLTPPNPIPGPTIG